jgi:DNA-directed RNA polymerase specialized sigma24 family protein
MPILPEEEQLLQSAFDWALRFYQRKGLNAQDAEDCAAEVRLHLLQHLQQGRPLSFAYAVQVARRAGRFHIRAAATSPNHSAGKRRLARGGGRAVSGAAGSSPLGVGATTP